MACERANVQIIQCFLDNAIVRNLDINARDNDGRTALRNVCGFQENFSDGHREIVKLLLKLPNIEVPRKGDESKFAPEIQSLLEEKWESMDNVEVVFFNDIFSDVKEVKKEIKEDEEDGEDKKDESDDTMGMDTMHADTEYCMYESESSSDEQDEPPKKCQKIRGDK